MTAAPCLAQTTESGSIADWLKIVPGEAHFYAEMRDLAGVRSLFRNLGIWETVRELSEAQPKGATTQPWHRKAEELLGMDADAAIDQILGRRSALIATEPQDWQSGVLLAELASADELGPLLKRWKAKPMSDEGVVKRYTLAGGLLLAVLERTIALGPADDPDGLWGRTVLLLSGRRGPMLAGRSEFAALRTRLSTNYPVLLYVTWPEGNPTAVAGCSRLLVGASVTGSQIACELQGQRATPVKDESACDVSLLGALPASTVAVLSDTFDFAGLGKEAGAGRFNDGVSLLTFAIGAFSAPDGAPSDLIGRMGPGFSVIVGPGRKAMAGEPEVPALAVVCPVKDGEEHVRQLDIVVGFLAQLLVATTVKPGEEMQEISVVTKPVGDVPVHRIDVGPALAKRSGLEALSRVELCWCLVDGRLLLGTSVAQLDEIVQASHGKAARIDGLSAVRGALPSVKESDEPTTGQWIYLRGSAAARMLNSWLSHLSTDHPEMLQESWWRQWAQQRVERYTRLGVALEPDPNSPVRAVVREVEADSPARSFLQPGDVILAAGGRALATTRPAHEVAQRYRDRGGSRRFELRVLRAGETRDVQIPVQPTNALDLEGFDPIDALRRIVTLTRRVDTLTVQRFTGQPDRLTARLTIRWSDTK